ncbi:hypothetical protein E2C01_064953 [Portunus trituberculatus]|uniref:Uncharacterized protein n=1 Tax=Portunus trituberculatus TaxID=210409 RepID=A0A5B7HLR2_PORTR|nr:hypothetical protein [Portunus trituberculatus]
MPPLCSSCASNTHRCPRDPVVLLLLFPLIPFVSVLPSPSPTRILTQPSQHTHLVSPPYCLPDPHHFPSGPPPLRSPSPVAPRSPGPSHPMLIPLPLHHHPPAPTVL